MRIYLDDKNLKDSFYPLTVTNRFEELRIGLFSFCERWERLAESQQFNLKMVKDASEADVVLPANKIPPPSLNLAAFFKKEQHDLDGFISINKLWDLTDHNPTIIASDRKLLNDSNFLKKNKHVNQIGGNDLLIHEAATVEHCFINTNDGPVVIDKHAHIMSGAMLRGPIYIGKHATVKMGAQLYGGANIGSHCTVGGEIKNSVFLAFTNKGHHGYTGDSYIGKWCNLGAGTTGSNVKNTAGAIRIWDQASLQFVKSTTKAGFFMGDHVKTAVNTHFNSGTVVSPFVNIFSSNLIVQPKFIPMFAWGLDSSEFYRLNDLLEEISRWMEMKKQLLTKEEKENIIQLYKQHIK